MLSYIYVVEKYRSVRGFLVGQRSRRRVGGAGTNVIDEGSDIGAGVGRIIG